MNDVQDAYTLRCVPQVHGASLDAMRYVREVLQSEANAVTDNPLVFSETGEVISGGNFMVNRLRWHLIFSVSQWQNSLISVSAVRSVLSTRSYRDCLLFLVKNGGVQSGS